MISDWRKWLSYMPAVLVAAGIAVLSLAEQTHAPALVINDKLMHLILYALLALALIVPSLKSKITNYIVVFVVTTMYGALMEILQRFCTLTRSGEMADLYADALGALIALLLVALIRAIINHKS